ncbi:MAG: MBOAT family O-acyltransferase, partial [Planctomycetota bacterium]|nr:MBOAT family O-acyltransferase [Planctomycetota bacterium]
LTASLFFYAWGEQEVVILMLASIVGNYAFGRWLGSAQERGERGKGVVTLSLVFNLALLVVFKYANWIWETLSGLMVELGLSSTGLPVIGEVCGPPLMAMGLIDAPLAADWQIRLPIGISFFTFQAMSYVIDIYRRDAEVQKNPIHFATYIALFPQLIAGPIVRYRDIAKQLVERTVTLSGFAYGVRRFVVGLGKKMLIANIVALQADRIFELPLEQVSAPLAWFGTLCYTLQIYFDFSGYSDMAIGLGHMFGFRFLENFNFPYISRSITEFWRRWHISLSSWYRDYLYIPLGGNRCSPLRVYGNLLTVFILCGLWHGASWSFLVWGLYHGLFLVIERLGLGRGLDKLAKPLRHAYTLLVVMIGWVFFRATDISQAIAMLSAMAGFGAEGAARLQPVGLFVDPVVLLALLAGLIGSMPWVRTLGHYYKRLLTEERGRGQLWAMDAASFLAVALILLLSAMEMSANTYNPFIYFRF